jgi:hypothetical protein
MQRRGAVLRKRARETLAGFLDPKTIPNNMAVLPPRVRASQV